LGDSSLSTGSSFSGADDHVKPIVIGTAIVLAVILGTCRGKFLRVMESR